MEGELDGRNDVVIQLTANATGVSVVIDGPFSFPVDMMHGWRIFFSVPVRETIKLFVLKETTDQEDYVRFQDYHPELIEEQVAEQMFVQLIASLLVSIAQSREFQQA